MPAGRHSPRCVCWWKIWNTPTSASSVRDRGGFRLAAAARDGPWMLPTTPEAQARTKYGSLLLEGGYGGAFILGLTPQDAYMRALAGTGTPTVLDNCVPNASVGYAGTDSWEGVGGVRHLAGLGHRKIAFERHAGVNGV
ncbi:MAG: hypothetical protein ACLRZH_11465 [Ruthenibacterium lactatiformans]